jgi:Ca-activated chloride channel family protein
MTDVALTINVDDANAADGDAINRLYPKGKFDLFAGDQAVIVGRYNVPGDAKATLEGKLSGEQKKFHFPAELAAHSEDDANAFVAKLWATRCVGEIIDEIDLKGRNDELVNELVEIATKHGILTPYTSFLADENNQVRELSELRDAAAESLTQLDAAEGERAFYSRFNKSSLQFAEKPAALPAAAGGPALATADAAGGYGGRFGVDSFHSTLETRGRGVVYYDSLQDRQVVAKSMINVGRKTFNRRGDRWVDATLSEEKEKSAKQIERFSDEYFALVAKHGKHVAPYLAIDEPMVIELDGQVYQW